MASNGKTSRRALFAELHGTGQRVILRVTPAQAQELRDRSASGSPPHVTVDPCMGAVTAIMNGERLPLNQVLARFTLQVDPSPFQPFVPEEWHEWIDMWVDGEGSCTRILLYGPTGTGKDTLFRLLFDRLKKEHGPDNMVILSLPPEQADRYVGHLEAKAEELKSAVSMAQDAGLKVILYLPEIERHFATGDYTGSWQLQWNAALRDVLDGTAHLRADYVLAATNYVARLESPVLNRFDRYAVRMSQELARGILQSHWPTQHTNGLKCDYVLDQLFRENVGKATLSSKKKIPLKATDLTGFNGRFLANMANDLGRQIKRRQRTHPDFAVDEAFANEILARHLDAMLAPVAEAAGTRRVGQFLVTQPDPFDPPMTITPTLAWCSHNKYRA